MKNWKLTSAVTAYFSNNNTVYFGDSESSKYHDTIKKQAGVNSRVLELENSEAEFKIKIKSGSLLISSKDFPDPSNFYKIGNFDNESILTIFESITMNNGVIDNTFEVVFDPLKPMVCFVLCDSMKEWPVAVEELRRRLIVTNSKKTTKMIPGHRYDLLDKTIVYLGEIDVHHNVDGNSISVYKEDPIATKYKAFITDTKFEKYKTISDVFKDKLISTSPTSTNTDYIYIKDKISLMVDSGEVLKDDISSVNMDSLIESMIDNYMTKNHIPFYEGSKQMYYENPEELFRIISYYPGKLNITPSVLNKITSVLEENFAYLLEDYYDSDKVPYNCKISSSKLLPDKALALVKLFYETLEESNMQREKYFGFMFNALGINIIELAKISISKFVNELPKYTLSLEKMIDHDLYFRSHFFSKYFKLIDTRYDKSQDIKKVISSPVLSNIITKIYEESKTTGGKGVKYFDIKNEGSTKNPFMCYQVEISINDIINYCGGLDKMEEDIKKELLNEKLFSIGIQDKLE